MVFFFIFIFYFCGFEILDAENIEINVRDERKFFE